MLWGLVEMDQWWKSGPLSDGIDGSMLSPLVNIVNPGIIEKVASMLFDFHPTTSEQESPFEALSGRPLEAPLICCSSSDLQKFTARLHV